MRWPIFMESLGSFIKNAVNRLGLSASGVINPLIKFLLSGLLLAYVFYYLGTDLKLAIVQDKIYGGDDAVNIMKKDNEDLFLNIVNLTPLIWATSVNVSLDFISVFQKNDNTSQIYACRLPDSKGMVSYPLVNNLFLNSAEFSVNYQNALNTMNELRDKRPDLVMGFYLKANLEYKKWPIPEILKSRRIYDLWGFTDGGKQVILSDLGRQWARGDNFKDPQLQHKALTTASLIGLIDEVDRAVMIDPACLAIIENLTFKGEARPFP